MVVEPDRCGVPILMSVSEEAAAAFLELHNRFKSLKEVVHGFVESGGSGLFTKIEEQNIPSFLANHTAELDNCRKKDVLFVRAQEEGIEQLMKDAP